MAEEKLIEVARKLIRAGPGKDLYRTLATRVRRALGRGIGTSFFLVYRASDVVIPVAESSETGRMHPEAYTQKIATGILGHVVKTGKTYYASDVAHDPLFHSGGQQGGSEVCVPVTFEEEVIGILNIEARKRNAFSPLVLAHIELLCEATGALMNSGVAAEQQQALEAQIEGLKSALRHYEQRFESLARSMDDAIIVVDGDGKIAFQNGAWSDSLAKHVGKSFESMLSPEDQKKWDVAEEKNASARLKLKLGRKPKQVLARSISLPESPAASGRMIVLRASPARAR